MCTKLLHLQIHTCVCVVEACDCWYNRFGKKGMWCHYFKSILVHIFQVHHNFQVPLAILQGIGAYHWAHTEPIAWWSTKGPPEDIAIHTCIHMVPIHFCHTRYRGRFHIWTYFEELFRSILILNQPRAPGALYSKLATLTASSRAPTLIDLKGPASGIRKRASLQLVPRRSYIC